MKERKKLWVRDEQNLGVLPQQLGNRKEVELRRYHWYRVHELFSGVVVERPMECGSKETGKFANLQTQDEIDLRQ